MKPTNFPERKAQRRAEAIARNEAYQQLTLQQKIQKAMNAPKAHVIDRFQLSEGYTPSSKQLAKLTKIN